jgi:hypothetical protein
MTGCFINDPFSIDIWERLFIRNELDDQDLILSRGEEFSLCHCAQAGSGAQLASYPWHPRGSFPAGKVAGA